MLLPRFVFLVGIFFSSYFCLECMDISLPSGIATTKRVIEIMGMLAGGVMVYKWDAIYCARWTLTIVLLGEISLIIGVRWNSIILAGVGLYACSFCANILIICVLTVISNWPKNTYIPLQLGLLSSSRILGGLSASLLSSLPSYRGFHLYSPLLMLCFGLFLHGNENRLDVTESSPARAEGSKCPSSPYAADCSSGIDDINDIGVIRDDIETLSPMITLTLDDLKKPLWPIRHNPAFVVAAVCGAVLAGPLLPLQGTYFDTENWSMVPYAPQEDGGSYSKNIWLRTVPFMVGVLLCPLIGFAICRHGTRPGLITMAAALCCVAHGMFPPDSGATVPKVVTLAMADATHTVALWSVIPVIVLSGHTGLAFSMLLACQRLAQVITVLFGVFVVTPLADGDTSIHKTHTTPSGIEANNANSIDIIFLCMSSLAVFASVWLIYIDETGNGTKASAMQKSLIPFLPLSGRRRAVYLPGALRRVKESATLSALLDSCEEDPRTRYSSPDIEVEINTMINRTSGKWDPNPHYLAFKTVSKGRRALEKELMSGTTAGGRSRSSSEGSSLISPRRSRSKEVADDYSTTGPEHNATMPLLLHFPPTASSWSPTYHATDQKRDGESAVPSYSMWGSDVMPASASGYNRTPSNSGSSGTVEAQHEAISEKTPLLPPSKSQIPSYTDSIPIPQSTKASSLPIPSLVPFVYYGAWYGDDGEEGEERSLAATLLDTGAASSLPTQTTMDRITKGVKFAGDVNAFPERRLGDGQHPRINMKKRRTRSAEDFPIRYYT